MLIDSVVVGPGAAAGINGDLINLWNKNATWGFAPNGPATGSRLQGFNTGCFTGKGGGYNPTLPECVELFATEWFFTSADADGNGEAGMNMVDGPFGFSAGFGGSFNIQKPATANDALFAVKNVLKQPISMLMDNDNLPTNITAGTFTVTGFDVTTAQGGTVADNGDGTLLYSPPANFTGFDSFTYRVDDGVDHTDPITIAIDPGTGLPKRPALGAEGFYKASGTVDIVVLDEALTAENSAVVASNSSSSGGVMGLFALPLMLLMLPLRLFTRKK